MLHPLVLVCFLILALPVSSTAASYQRTDGTIVDPILRIFLEDGGIHPYAGIDLAPGAALHGAALGGADLRGADLRGADLTGADLFRTHLVGADLRDAALAGVRSGEIVGTPLLPDAFWFTGTGSGGFILGPGVDLRGATLFRLDLSGANLIGADLSHAILLDLSLGGTDFTGASLRRASLASAELLGAILSGADLRGASLADAEFLGQVVGSPRYDAETDFTDAWHAGRFSSPFDPVAAGWTFVPEPGTGLLLGLGLAGLAHRRR